MMLDRIHPSLRRAVVMFSATLAFVLAIAVVFYLYMDNAKEEKTQAERALKIWKNRVDASRRNNNIIDTYESTYLNLVDQRVIGEEDRLSWYEAIQATSEARGMPSVKYTVSTQETTDENRLIRKFKGLQLYRSTMTMDVRMAHEGDLFALLNNLSAKANGLYVVDKCDIEKAVSKQPAAQFAYSNNMKAYCELSWYTIKAKKQKKG